MKIALISHTAHLDGAERMLLNLARMYNTDSKYCVILLYPAIDIDIEKGDAFLPYVCDNENIMHYAISGTSNYIFMNESNRNQVAHQNNEYRAELEEAYKLLGVEAVLVNTLTSAAPVMAARALGLPVALWVHGILDSYMINQRYNASHRLLIDRILLSLCNEVVCCSDWTADYYKSILEKPLHVIPNWTISPIHITPISALCNNFVCLTTLDEQKGIFVLLEAARQLRDQNYEFSLHIYGDGKERDRVVSFIQEYCLVAFVSLLPRIQDVSSAYNSALCIIQPSYIESFGMTVLEGMAYGRPVIATASGGPNGLIEDGITGFLVQRGDSSSMFEKMKYLIEHRSIAEAMGNKGRISYLSTYTSSHAKERFSDLFCHLLYSQDAYSPEKLLLDDMIEYIFRLNDTILYRIRASLSDFKRMTMRNIFIMRHKIGHFIRCIIKGKRIGK